MDSVPRSSPAAHDVIESGATPAGSDAAHYIFDVLHGPDAPSVDLVITGQLNLAELLVLIRAKERGANPDDYRAKADEILQELSAGFPG